MTFVDQLIKKYNDDKTRQTTTLAETCLNSGNKQNKQVK